MDDVPVARSARRSGRLRSYFDIRPTAGRRLGSRAVLAGIAFAMLPAVTCGLGTAVAFGFAALLLPGLSRRAAATLWVSTAAYAGATSLLLINLDAAAGSLGDGVSVAAWIVLFGGGWLQALGFAPWVAAKVAGPDSNLADGIIEEAAAAEHANLEHDPSLRLALRQRERRRLSREILTADPALARTLAIGRPDLDRTFADGGLIDVNQVPAWVLADLPGLDSELAQRIVDARTHLDGLRSPADFVVYADIPNEVVEALIDILVFPPNRSGRDQGGAGLDSDIRDVP
jgi:hypothetical protein